jgi:hypothetical protein
MMQWIAILDTWLLMLAAGLTGGAGVALAVRKLAEPSFDASVVSIGTFLTLGGLAFFLVTNSIGHVRGRVGLKAGLVFRVIWFALLIWACWFQPEPWFRLREPLQVQGTFEEEFHRQRIEQLVLFILLTLPFGLLTISRILFRQRVADVEPAAVPASSRAPWVLAGAAILLCAVARVLVPYQEGLGPTTTALLIGETAVLFELARRSVSGTPRVVAALGVIVVGSPLVCFWPI